jgi:hypothetical protein
MFNRRVLLCCRYAYSLMGIVSVTIFLTMYYPLHLPIPAAASATREDSLSSEQHKESLPETHPHATVTAEKTTKTPVQEAEETDHCCPQAHACLQTCKHATTKIGIAVTWLRSTWADMFGVHGKYQWFYMMGQELLEWGVQARYHLNFLDQPQILRAT